MVKITLRTAASLLLTLAAGPLAAQKTELRLALNSGIFHYKVTGAESTSVINYSSRDGRGYTNDMFGSHGAPGYGLSLDLQRATRYGLLLGLRAGPEVLRSRQQISEISVYDGFATHSVAASGSTRYSQAYLDISPFVGWRIPARGLSFDLSAGLEFALPLSAWESGSAQGADGQRYAVSSYRRYTDQPDGRYRFQLGASYRRYGAYIGYSAGQVNMRSSWRGSSAGAYSRYFRIGFSRRF